MSTLVLRKKKVLNDAFAQVDRNNTGYISSDKWAGVLEHVTGLQIAWHDLVDVLVSPEDRDGDNIQWAKFISKVHTCVIMIDICYMLL